MPVETDSLLNRPVMDIALYFYAMGMQRALPTVSDERACESFAKACGPLFRSPSTEALRYKILRMKTEELNALLTDPSTESLRAKIVRMRQEELEAKRTEQI